MDGLHRAFDEMRFGAARTLNLRAHQPTVIQAVAIAESWLRSLQVQGAGDALIITGRGNNSVDGVSPVRAAVMQLLPSLRRRNVLKHFQEHTPGSFVVTFASVGALFEAPLRRRERGKLPPLALPETLAALDEETVLLLRDLATGTLQDLGIKDPTSAQVGDEMQRQFGALSGSIAESGDREALLQQALMRATEDRFR